MSRNSIPVDWCIKDANTKAFHDTWLVRSRTPLPDMSSQSFKDELGQLLTMVQNKGTDNAAFLDSGLLLRAFKFILLAGGYIEDYRNLEDDKYQPGYFRWDAARVAAVAGHSQPSVPYLEFARTMELTQAARDRVAECNGEEPVDVMQVIWQAGADLVIEYGRVLPERKRPGGRSQYDLLERWIEQNPSRMAKSVSAQIRRDQRAT